MARNKNIEREPRIRRSKQPKKRVAFWKKPWVWTVTGVGAIALLLSNVTSILTDARGLPKEFGQTSKQFFEWYGAYGEWKGRWTYFPEGDIEMASMKLTEEPFQLVIDVTDEGEVIGSIETRGICEKVPYFDALMLSGTIKSGSRADIVTFDYVNGFRSNFAKLSLERDGGVMIVRPTDDPLGAFAKESRIALAPDGLNDPAEFERICPRKREEFIKRALGKRALGSSMNGNGERKPVEQFLPSQN